MVGRAPFRAPPACRGRGVPLPADWHHPRRWRAPSASAPTAESRPAPGSSARRAGATSRRSSGCRRGRSGRRTRPAPSRRAGSPGRGPALSPGRGDRRVPRRDARGRQPGDDEAGRCPTPPRRASCAARRRWRDGSCGRSSGTTATTPGTTSPGSSSTTGGTYHLIDSQIRGWGQRNFPVFHDTAAAERARDLPDDGRLDRRRSTPSAPSTAPPSALRSPPGGSATPGR